MADDEWQPWMESESIRDPMSPWPLCVVGLMVIGLLVGVVVLFS